MRRVDTHLEESGDCLFDRRLHARHILVEPEQLTTSRVDVTQLIQHTVELIEQLTRLTFSHTAHIAMITTTKVIWQKMGNCAQPTLHLYSPGGSIGLMVWLQFTIARFV